MSESELGLDDSGLPGVCEEPKHEEGLLLEEVSKMRSDLAKLVKDLSKTKEEVVLLKKQLKTKEEKWDIEKASLTQQIQKLESVVLFKKDLKPMDAIEEKLSLKVNKNEKKIKVLEENERDVQKKRRRNIIIRNLNSEVNVSAETLKQKTNELFKQVLQTRVKAEKVEIIAHSRTGESIVEVKLTSLQDKLDVMKNKYKLREYQKRRIYISDDLPSGDRRIQREILAKVQEHRRNGKDSKAGFRKIYVNGVWTMWE